MHIYDTPKHISAFSTTRDGSVETSIPRLFMPLHQVHGTVTKLIDEEFLRLNPLQQALALDGVDALATNVGNICVCVRTADCIPVLMWDDQTNVVSAVHAGWKGTVKRIVESNIDLLSGSFGTKAENIHAIIGPGIGWDSFEVGDEVYDIFTQAGFSMEQLAKRYPLMNVHAPKAETLAADAEPKSEAATKWHINLWECNRLQLINKGVNPNNIHVAGIDTYQQYDRFCSARRKCDGRIINGIMMKA